MHDSASIVLHEVAYSQARDSPPTSPYLAVLCVVACLSSHLAFSSTVNERPIHHRLLEVLHSHIRVAFLLYREKEDEFDYTENGTIDGL